jgi:uncharacterized protein with PIN domain
MESGVTEKLLADAMLGRLAKWLRVLGYDTAYLAGTDDFAVMRQARAEDRLILTRDHDFTARKGVRALLIESEVLEEQLRQVRAAVGPPAGDGAPRCPVCNHPLQEVPVEQVADRIPPYIRRKHEHFAECDNCRRVYWRGTHWQRMEALINKVWEEAGDDAPD